MAHRELTLPLVLASASPRRAELLAQIGLAFTALPSHVPEPPPLPGDDLLAWAQHAALEKARMTAELLPADPALVLGADTVVVLPTERPVAPLLHGQPVTVLGKPRDAAEATTMLTTLSGRAHAVISAFALVHHPSGEAITDVVETQVFFRRLSAEEIAAYVASGEPLDKAGAYGIQGFGAVLVDRIEGDYFTVVGLPLARVWQRLAPWLAG